MKLMLGDCLELMKQIPDKSVDAIITDLPYGITACKWDSVIPFAPMWEQLKRIIKPNGAIVLFGSQPFTSALIMSNPKMFKYCWSWVKEAGTGFLNAKKYPLKNVEDVAVFCMKTHRYNPQMEKGKPYSCKKGGKTDNYNKDSRDNIVTVNDGYRYPLTELRFSRDKSKVHPTQKPVALIKYLIKTYTNEGETVLDFTMGSGSTGVACVDTGRRFIGIEKDEKYFEIAKVRIEKAGVEQ